MSTSKGVTIQSVQRALRILDLFAEADELGISEISEIMMISKSTIFGLVNTLVQCGYLEQNAENKKYRLGVKLFEMGSLVLDRMDLRGIAKPFCEKLSNKYNSTVHLAEWLGDEMLYIDKVDSPDAIVHYSRMGKRAPLYCTGVGKAILALLPEEEVDAYLQETEMTPHTAHTITSPQKLKEELKATKKRGYAIDNQEMQDGLVCVAAVIFNHLNHPVASVSLSIPTSQLAADVENAAQKDILQVAEAISRQLGSTI